MSDKRPILKLNSILEHIKIEDKTEKDVKVDVTTSKSINEKQAAISKQVLTTRKFPISKEKYKEILKLLRNTYPKCFTIPPKPFVIGIHKKLYDLQHERLTKTAIRHFLKLYCSRKEYKNALTVGSTRVNLDGSASSLVTEEETATQRRKADNSNDI